MEIPGQLSAEINIQSALVSNQHIIYGLRPEARSRVNTVFMGGVFLGGAAGSAMAAATWHSGGWTAVSGLGLASAAFACAVQALAPRLRAADHESSSA